MGSQRIKSFLGEGSAPVSSCMFVPYALKDHDSYYRKAKEAFDSMDIALDSIHLHDDPKAAANAAESIFIGGGNTFRLLKTLYDNGLVEIIRDRVSHGTPYIGTSAGSNVATASIRTTNDMPIVQPPTFDALRIVPFQINAHYLDPPTDSTHMGETRETRLREFHEENDTPVLGLREGSMVLVEGSQCTLLGLRPARVFRRDEPGVE